MKKNKIPNHIAIIMDGNGRWAIKRSKPRLFGHKAGIQSLKKVVDACLDFNIKILSVFAFSTENWSRPKQEVDGIMSLIHDLCEDDYKEFVDKGVKVVTMGDLSRLNEELQSSIKNIVQKTKNNDKLILNIAINYGARAEIARAFNLMQKDKVLDCDENTIKQYLYTKDLPDPDLIIRASGENRLSNFMLFQSAYSEFYFPKVLWPDFDKKIISKAIKVYQKRNRRYGGL